MTIKQLLKECETQKMRNNALLKEIAKIKIKYKSEELKMKSLTFKEVSDMFIELQKKGYKVEEIMTMPIEIGKKEELVLA